MKKIFALVFVICGFMAINAQAQKTEDKTYGQKFSEAGMIRPEDLSSKMNNKTSIDNVVVAGTIAQVCQAEGCWLKIKNGKGEDILVKFKDHAFFVPKDIAGKTVVVNGKAVKKTISIAERKHMAEDAGASKDEIAAINAPKEELRIEATGVIVK